MPIWKVPELMGRGAAAEETRRREMAPSSPLWQLLPGRRWPSSAIEEQTLVADLEAHCGGRAAQRYDRGDVTSLLNTLRCGLDLDALLAIAPGLQPAKLLAAYRHIEDLRAESAKAWKAICADPTVGTITANASVAARLLPVPLYRLTPRLHTTSAESLANLVQRTAQDVANAAARAARIEERLARISPPSDVAIELGRMLYNPYTPALWGDAFYLPPRVGALMPLRVCDLLGERRR